MKFILPFFLALFLSSCACQKTDDGEWHVHQAKCVFMRTVYDEDGREWVGFFLASGEMIGPLLAAELVEPVVPDGELHHPKEKK